MRRFYHMCFYALLGSFLSAMPLPVPVAMAASQDMHLQHKPPQENIKFRRAFQARRPPVESSLIRPSVRRSPVPDKIYRQNKARNALRSGHIVSLSIIRKRIRQSFPGKIVDVRLLEPNRKNRPYIYKVKVLRKDGKLLELKINAATAKIVSVKGNG